MFERSMSRAKADKLRLEYRRQGLGPGIRGKYHRRYANGTNLVLLSPDVATAFPNEAAVNEALRSLIRLAQRATSRVTGSRSG